MSVTSMDAREISEALSDGIGAIAAILAALEPNANRIGAADMSRSTIAVRLEAMERALERVMIGADVQTTLRVSPADLERVRALRELVRVWDEDDAPTIDLRQLAKEAFAWVLSWRSAEERR